MPTIRPAATEDARRLVTFAAQSFRDTFGPDNSAADMDAYVQSAFSLEGQLATLSDPTSLVLIAEDASGIAAYAEQRAGVVPAIVDSDAAVEIERFYVAAHWQGRGLARELMVATLDAAAARGAKTVWLGVWERNARAIAFYTRMGFVPVGSKPFVLGGDVQTDLVMVRSVSSRE